MRLLSLYIENFACIAEGLIDFTNIKSSVVIGEKNGDHSISNGAGKTSIFKAIGFALFSELEDPIEKVIRFDQLALKVILDFEYNNTIYRIVRSKSKKNTSLSFYQRNFYDKFDHDVSTWKDISSRTATQTEEDISKIVKIDYSTFLNTTWFMQRKDDSIANATPEKRKQILRESLNLLIYKKLETLAKEKKNEITTAISSKEAVISSIGNPEKDIEEQEKKIILFENQIASVKNSLNVIAEELLEETNKKQDLLNQLLIIDSNSSTFLKRKTQLEQDIKQFTTQLEQKSKSKNDLLNQANELVAEIKDIELKINDLLEKIMIEIDKTDFQTQISSLKSEISLIDFTVKANIEKIENLHPNIPEGDFCLTCKQPITIAHKQNCKVEADKQIKILKEQNEEFSKTKIEKSKTLKELTVSYDKQKKDQEFVRKNQIQIDSYKKDLDYKKKDLNAKKLLFKDTKTAIQDIENVLKSKNEDLAIVFEDLKKIDLTTINNIKENISKKEALIKEISSRQTKVNLSLGELNSNITTSKTLIKSKNSDISKRDSISAKLKEIEYKYRLLPDVIQGFGTNGIPNLIISNVLDTLQANVNMTLGKLKPGMQINFILEKQVAKTKEVKDTLELGFFVNSREISYSQLSGAQKVSVHFALKLGLSKLLQNIYNVKLQFLLLDECEESFDDFSVHEFHKLIKFLEEEYMVLIISHNKLTKDFIKNKIILKQNLDNVSKIEQI